MREKMLPLHFSSSLLDIVGTGGDGAHTLNISTGSAILSASCGVKVAKHGNRKVSSQCGSADVLQALGIDIEMDCHRVLRSLETVGIGFLFAPLFHPMLGGLKEVRSKLQVRTAFNIIAPLLNPARAEYLLLGVFDPSLLSLLACTLQKMGTKRSFLFHGNGIDELSCLGPSQIIEVTSKGIHSFVLDPSTFGLSYCSLEDLRGKDASYNANKLLEAFEGKESAFSDTLCLNAGIAVYLYGLAPTIEEGIQTARKHLSNKSCLSLLDEWRKI
jgi:anthranilate phosphoribosyltransferase